MVLTINNISNQLELNNKEAWSLLLPLMLRAKEQKRPKPIVDDRYSSEIARQINIDFRTLHLDRHCQIGVALRTRYLDNLASIFVITHEHPVIVNLGCELNMRYQRVCDDLRKRGYNHSETMFSCYDIDREETISLRRNIAKETANNTFISTSISDKGWMKELLRKHPYGEFLFICEHALIKVEEQQAFETINSISQTFPIGTKIFFERTSARIHPKSLLRSMKINMYYYNMCHYISNWKCNKPATIEQNCPTLRLDSEYYYMAHAGLRGGIGTLLATLFPAINRMYGIWGFEKIKN